MRMRKKKNQDSRIAACSPIMCLSPEDYRGRWSQYFDNKNDIYIEIGCGKGMFITTLAQKNKDINFLAIEREEAALLSAMELAATMDIPNLRFISLDAGVLDQIFADGEISRIYLNFSDPWPPKKHMKRRLTHKNFLEKYLKILKPHSEIHFKTDNIAFFEFSIASLAESGFSLGEISRDLSSSGFENILTEYENKFILQGIKINRLVATKV